MQFTLQTLLMDDKLSNKIMCSFTGVVFHSRCGDYIWVSGIYGHCTVEGKTLSIEDITRNVLQGLTGNTVHKFETLCYIHFSPKHAAYFVRLKLFNLLTVQQYNFPCLSYL